MLKDFNPAELLKNVGKIIFFIGFCNIISATYAEKSNPQTAKLWSLETMMQAKIIGDVLPSPDGKLIAYTETQFLKTTEGWKSAKKIFIVDLKNKATINVPLPLNQQPMNPEWSPDGNKLAFLLNDSKGAHLEIWSIKDIHSKPITLVTSPGIPYYRWSPNSKMIAYVKEDQEPEDLSIKPNVVGQQDQCNNLYLIQVPAHDNSPKKAMDQDTLLIHYSKATDCQAIKNFDWSPNNQIIAYSYYPANKHDFWNYGKINLVDVNSKEINSLSDQNILQQNPTFSPDGKNIAFSDLNRVYWISLKDRDLHPFALTNNEAPINIMGWSADNQQIYVFEDYHTYSTIVALPISGQAGQIISPENQLIGKPNLNASHQVFGFTMQNTNHPIEAYISPATSPLQPLQITFSNKHLLNLDIPKTEIIRWQAKDGLSIEGLLTYPLHYESGKRYPILVELHGGPGDVSQQHYIGQFSVFPIALYANKGFFYFQPNIRGSGGSGEKFRRANHNDWAGRDYQDILDGLSYLSNQGLIDKNRVGILGWSYGGYLVAWAITQSDLFKVAVIGAGMIDLISYAGVTDLPFFVPEALSGYFWDIPKIYLERSPIMYVKNIHTPTLLHYGEDDLRVPYSQGLELYGALKLLNIPVKMVTYPQSKHAIEDPNLKFESVIITEDWIARYLPVSSEENSRGG